MSIEPHGPSAPSPSPAPGWQRTLSRFEWLCLLLLTGELLTGMVLAYRQYSRPAPPPVDGSFADALTQAELQEQAASCRTAKDWKQLGTNYLAAGYFPEAEACLREASRRAPAEADYAFAHAFALERLGQIEAAIAAYEEALRRGHHRPADVHYYVGKNHLRLEQTEAAWKAFVNAGDLAAARYERALLAERRQAVDEARHLAEQLARDFPEAYQPAGLLHRLALLRGDIREAAIWADQFNYRPRPLPTPFDHEADWVFRTANGLGRDRLFRDAGRHYQLGQWDQTEQLLRQAQQTVWTPEVADRLADTLFLQGRQAEAQQVLMEILERSGPSWEVLWRIGQIEAGRGRLEEALRYWERAREWATGPLAAELYRDLSEAYQRLQHSERSRQCLGRAHLLQGIQQLDQGQWANAAAELEQAVRLAPELADAWFFLGEARRCNHQEAEARRAYQECLQRQPHHGRATEALAHLNR